MKEACDYQWGNESGDTMDCFVVTVFAPNGYSQDFKVGEGETASELMVRALAAFAGEKMVLPLPAEDTTDTYMMVHEAREFPLDAPLVRIHPAVDQKSAMNLRPRIVPVDAEWRVE